MASVDPVGPLPKPLTLVAAPYAPQYSYTINTVQLMRGVYIKIAMYVGSDLSRCELINYSTVHRQRGNYVKCGSLFT